MFIYVVYQIVQNELKDHIVKIYKCFVSYW